MNSIMATSDHDLLIEIDQQLKDMKVQMTTFATKDNLDNLQNEVYGVGVFVIAPLLVIVIAQAFLNRKKKE